LVKPLAMTTPWLLAKVSEFLEVSSTLSGKTRAPLEANITELFSLSMTASMIS